MDSFITIFDEKEPLPYLQQSNENAFIKIYNYYWRKLFYKAANLSDARGLMQYILSELWWRTELNSIAFPTSYPVVFNKYIAIELLLEKSQAYDKMV